MSDEANKALLRRFFDEVMNRGELDAIDEIFTPDFVNRHAHPGQTPGSEGLRTLARNVRQGFPDITETPEDIVAGGDRVAVRFTMRGTHLGEWRGVPATGKRVEAMGVIFARVEDGRIPEGWFFFDREAVWEQLGVAPPAQR